jgi:hypothetical protein
MDTHGDKKQSECCGTGHQIQQPTPPGGAESCQTTCAVSPLLAKTRGSGNGYELLSWWSTHN